MDFHKTTHAFEVEVAFDTFQTMIRKKTFKRAICDVLLINFGFGISCQNWYDSQIKYILCFKQKNTHYLSL